MPRTLIVDAALLVACREHCTQPHVLTLCSNADDGSAAAAAGAAAFSAADTFGGQGAVRARLAGEPATQHPPALRSAAHSTVCYYLPAKSWYCLQGHGSGDGTKAVQHLSVCNVERSPCSLYIDLRDVF